MQSQILEHVLSEIVSQAQSEGVQKFVVGAVIRINGKFLLLERNSADFMGGLVELPSGTVDSGEDLLISLSREVHEETGLSIALVVRYLGSFDYISSSGKKTRQFNFLVESEPGAIILNPEEHVSYHLVAPSDEEFERLNISDATKMVIFTVPR